MTMIIYKFYYYSKREGVISLVISSEIEEERDKLYKLAYYKAIGIFQELREKRYKYIIGLSKLLNKKVPVNIGATELEECYKKFPEGWRLEKTW